MDLLRRILLAIVYILVFASMILIDTIAYIVLTALALFILATIMVLFDQE